jgi:cytochrome c556
MRQHAIAFGALAALAPFASAQEPDPIETRQALMHANGAAAGIAVGVMREQLDYSPVVGRASIMTMHAVSESFGDYFPEGSLDTERSLAAPAIWEDMEGFRAALEEFRTAASAAVDAAGEDGPADAAAFVGAVRPVLDTCQSCHEDYRLEDD